MEEADSESDADDLEHNLLTVDAVLRLDATTEYRRVSHREGEGSLPGSSEFFLVKDVLFDTGALVTTISRLDVWKNMDWADTWSLWTDQ